MVNTVEHLLETAKENLVKSRPNAIPQGHKAVNFIQCGLEGFEPEKDRYDIVWVQWALMYLTDGMT